MIGLRDKVLWKKLIARLDVMWKWFVDILRSRATVIDWIIDKLHVHLHFEPDITVDSLQDFDRLNFIPL